MPCRDCACPTEGCGGAEWAMPAPAAKAPKLRINNTLLPEQGAVEFVPRDGNTVSWYTCGPTVSDPPTLAHCRTLVTFDILRRILEDYFGYSVTYVMGITDIDDGIIVRTRQIEALVAEGYRWHDALKALQTKARTGCALLHYDTTLNAAREWLVSQGIQPVPDAAATVPDVGTHVGNEGLNIHPLTSEMETLYCEHFQRLGIKLPTAFARVSEHIPAVIEFVEKILENGYAYEANGNIYFDIDKFSKSGHTYSKLMPCSAEDCDGVLTENCEGLLFSNEEGVKEKRSPKDFVLWRRSKEGEPKWASPWGHGRPGWHIECSVMASNVFGDVMDIHSGGEDLKFPHHDNELAQSEARWETDQWVNYFIHHGHLHVDFEGSKNKTITIERILESYTPSQIRMFFLLRLYDEAVVFSSKSMCTAVDKVEEFKNFFAKIKAALAVPRHNRPECWGAEEMAVSGCYHDVREKVHAALCNNFDTRSAMAQLSRLAARVMEYIGTRGVARTTFLEDIREYMRKMLRCFGLINGEEACFLQDPTQHAFEAPGVSAVVKAFLDFKNMIQTEVATALPGESADAIAEAVNAMCNTLAHDTLPSLGVVVDDADNGDDDHQGFRYTGAAHACAHKSPQTNGVTPNNLPPMPPL